MTLQVARLLGSFSHTPRPFLHHAPCTDVFGNDRLPQVYEEIVANMTKPLGITIEASTDQAELIYITSVGQQVG